ncbi:12794_t:CDS:2, partial [Racocetra persica]
AAKPIISNAFLNRVQVDLISMASIPMVIIDHYTQYSWACTLTSKQPIEVAIFLFDVFVCFGAPIILQTDNDHEFTAKSRACRTCEQYTSTKVSKWMEDTQRRDWARADDLPENWFESSEPQDDFDQQEIVESLLGAVVLNEQQLLELVDEELENEQVDNERDDNKRVDDDERVNYDEMVNNNERVNDDEMVNNDERVDYNEMVNNDKRVDENEMVDDDERVDNDEKVHNDESVNNERVDNKRVDDDESVDIERVNYRSVYNERVNDERVNNKKMNSEKVDDKRVDDNNNERINGKKVDNKGMNDKRIDAGENDD